MTDIQQLPLILNYRPQCGQHPTRGRGGKGRRREDKWRERERELTEAIELAVQGLHVARRRVRERADSLSDGTVYKHCVAWIEGEKSPMYNSSQPPQCQHKEQCDSSPKRKERNE